MPLLNSKPDTASSETKLVTQRSDQVCLTEHLSNITGMHPFFKPISETMEHRVSLLWEASWTTLRRFVWHPCGPGNVFAEWWLRSSSSSTQWMPHEGRADASCSLLFWHHLLPVAGPHPLLPQRFIEYLPGSENCCRSCRFCNEHTKPFPS